MGIDAEEVCQVLLIVGTDRFRLKAAGQQTGGDQNWHYIICG